MKRVTLIAVLALTAACGGGGSNTTGGGTSAAPKLRFAVMPKTLDLPVFNYAKTGAEREAAKRGNIEIIWRAPESADQLRQKEILESSPGMPTRRSRSAWRSTAWTTGRRAGSWARRR
jgi:ABC-type sugar transport system substrate-binding protein